MCVLFRLYCMALQYTKVPSIHIPTASFRSCRQEKTTSVSYLSARSLFIKAIPLCSSISVLINIKPYFLTNSFLYKLLYESTISITHCLFLLFTKALISAHNLADISLSLSQIIILYNVLHLSPKSFPKMCKLYINVPYILQ